MAVFVAKMMMYMVVSGVILWLFKITFNVRTLAMFRIYTLVTLGGAINFTESSVLTAILVLMFVLYTLYVFLVGVVGWIYNKVTGGRKITLSSIIMFVLGWIGTGKLLEWEKRRKAEHEMRMKGYGNR